MTTDIDIQLESVYEEIMWLANRPNVTPSVARAWYTHATSERLKKYVRMFTGMVSTQALENVNGELRLEHYLRIQRTLTKLVEKHIQVKKYDPNEFINTIMECEKVHIVTKKENYAAMTAEGDYTKAGIELVSWSYIPLQERRVLWKKMLKGKVANFGDFNPE